MSARSWLGKPAGRRAETSQPATQPYSSCAKQQQQQLPNLQARESAAAAAAAAELIHSLSLSVFLLSMRIQSTFCNCRQRASYSYSSSVVYTPRTLFFCLLLLLLIPSHNVSQCEWILCRYFFSQNKMADCRRKKMEGRLWFEQGKRGRRNWNEAVVGKSFVLLRTAWKSAESVH